MVARPPDVAAPDGAGDPGRTALPRLDHYPEPPLSPRMNRQSGKPAAPHPGLRFATAPGIAAAGRCGVPRGRGRSGRERAAGRSACRVRVARGARQGARSSGAGAAMRCRCWAPTPRWCWTAASWASRRPCRCARHAAAACRGGRTRFTLRPCWPQLPDSAPLDCLNITRVTFARAGSRTGSRVYCDTGDPMDKAGAYGVQGRAAEKITRIEGSFSGVMGLPLYETCRIIAPGRSVILGAPLCRDQSRRERRNPHQLDTLGNQGGAGRERHAAGSLAGTRQSHRLYRKHLQGRRVPRFAGSAGCVHRHRAGPDRVPACPGHGPPRPGGNGRRRPGGTLDFKPAATRATSSSSRSSRIRWAARAPA